MNNNDLEARVTLLENKIKKLEKQHKVSLILKIIYTAIIILVIGFMYYFISNYYNDILSTF